ncbi:MAG TPA: ADP-ribosylglycohydrolase family protein [Steroidobacteraceae bacterium]|nr:ADP-ribosylglycohydrolase family protein [Steroidobacteraceae bacterium]
MEARQGNSGTRAAGPGSTLPLPESVRNCYWVVAGRLLAGMHPWSESRTSTLERLRELKAVGIDSVIDLTHPDESAGYAVEYPALLARFGVEHRRVALPDHAVPGERAAVVAALDAVDAALEAGRTVYLHCRAGIGRTGLVVGCWLARHGSPGEPALARLNELWSGSRLAATWLRVPETDQQAKYVCDWRERPAQRAAASTQRHEQQRARAPTESERCVGAVLGMAIAESAALDPGSLSRSGPAALGWGGHTAMTLCLAESLVSERRNDPWDQMRRYIEWVRLGRPSSTGVANGVPEEVKRALAHWQWSHKPVAGSHDPAKSDPHTLPRTAAVALYFRAQPQQAIAQAAEASRTTHQSPVVLDGCRAVAALVLDAVSGFGREALIGFEGPAARSLATLRLKPPVQRVIDGEWRKSSGRLRTRATVRGVLTAALRGLEQSEQFPDGLHHVLEISAEPAPAAALYGAIAGAHFGTVGLPPAWCEGLRQRSLLEDVAQRLYESTWRG